MVTKKNYGLMQKKIRLAEAQNWRCAYCGCRVSMDEHPRSLTYATVDHLRPYVAGGRSGPDNVVIACLACNEAKSASNASHFFDIRKRLLDEGKWKPGQRLDASVLTKLVKERDQAVKAEARTRRHHDDLVALVAQHRQEHLASGEENPPPVSTPAPQSAGRWREMAGRSFLTGTAVFATAAVVFAAAMQGEPIHLAMAPVLLVAATCHATGRWA